MSESAADLVEPEGVDAGSADVPSATPPHGDPLLHGDGSPRERPEPSDPTDAPTDDTLLGATDTDEPQQGGVGQDNGSMA